MKTNNKILYTFLFALIALSSGAQSKTDNSQGTRNPNWIISKDVQKISNRNLSSGLSLTIASMGTPDWVQSKDVMKGSKMKNKRISEAGNLVSRGYPQWIISKGVQRIRK